MIGHFSSLSHKSSRSYPMFVCTSIARTGLLLLVAFSCNTESVFPARADRYARYTNSWAVEVRGGRYAADELAREQGFVNMGEVGNLKDMYHFVLNEDEVVLGGERATRSLQSVELREDRFRTMALKRKRNVGYVMQQQLLQMDKRVYLPPEDPDWTLQWSLLNNGQTAGPSGLDVNVEPVWIQGITGNSVVVSVVDDGLEINHPDLHVNYDAQASRDFIDHDDDPTPYYSPVDSNLSDYHGTACAGVIGMARNGLCGVGVAPGASIGGLRLNLSFTYDLTQATILGFQDNYVDIYSNSWGPLETGFTVGGPGYLTKETLKYESEHGRNMKGSIYVFASGNGGRYHDSCAADGFVNSIYTIAVGSADQNGRQADYDEDCPAKMAVTFSHNSDTFPADEDTWESFNQMHTTSLNGECMDSFTGTSASAPLVSGVVALALEANPNLTWRDVQYLIAYTSNPDVLTGDDWVTNGAGLRVSHHFGFGAIDAEAMVTRARQWSAVPPQQTQTISPHQAIGNVPASSSVVMQFVVDSSNWDFSSVQVLEHVVLTASLQVQGYSQEYDFQDFFLFSSSVGNDTKLLKDWLSDPHPRRGDIKLELTSPQGTTSTILPYRDYDFVNAKGYKNWPFMSVHYWGENPSGTWMLRVHFRSSAGSLRVNNVALTLYGTAITAESVRSIPTQCDTNCARGCSGEGPGMCDACRNLRVASTLLCVDECPGGYWQYHSYCVCNRTNCDMLLSTDDSIQQNNTQNNVDHLSLQWILVIIALSSAVILGLVFLVLIIIWTVHRAHKRQSRRNLSYTFVRLQENIYSSALT